MKSKYIVKKEMTEDGIPMAVLYEFASVGLKQVNYFELHSQLSFAMAKSILLEHH